jgi:hypothetical protein
VYRYRSAATGSRRAAGRGDASPSANVARSRSRTAGTDALCKEGAPCLWVVRDRPERDPHDNDTLDPVPVIEIVVALPDATLTLSDGRLLVTRDPLSAA